MINNIKFGFQTYGWQMSKETFAGKLKHITSVIAKAGMQGIEAEVQMMGEYYNSPLKFKDLLEQNKLNFSALALPLWWRKSEETDEEKKQADLAINYLKNFPGTILVLCHLPGDNRHNLKEERINQWQCLSAVAKRAAAQGITAVFHPNSSSGSLFRTSEDYEWLFDKISASKDLFYCPDAGHIAHGNMNVLEIFKQSRNLIKHVHFKDMTLGNDWAPMGKGDIDFPAIVKFLKDTEYNGWIMVEEESQQSVTVPDIVAVENGNYVNTFLKIDMV